jgi:transposase
MTVPGIGPIISSAIVAAIGAGDAFSKGRDFGAWLGLTTCVTRKLTAMLHSA